MSNGYPVTDELFLWWLADPASPRQVGTLRLVRRAGSQPAGVSLSYAEDWLRHGLPLSEDLPLKPGECPNAARSS